MSVRHSARFGPVRECGCDGKLHADRRLIGVTGIASKSRGFSRRMEGICIRKADHARARPTFSTLVGAPNPDRLLTVIETSLGCRRLNPDNA